MNKPVDAALATRTDLHADATRDIAAAMNGILADVFALYLKSKNFHWHMSGPHFRDYHLLLDEQADQVFAMTDDLAERARKIGGTSLRSIGDIARHQRLQDNDEEFVPPHQMPAELTAVVRAVEKCGGRRGGPILRHPRGRPGTEL